MGADLIAAVDWNYVLNFTENTLKVLAGLGFVIFVHELGHFLVAKACGVKCEKFYIGFDIPMPFGIPSRICRFQWGETEYGIGILPLGGYVKMLGQDDNPMRAEEEAERTRIRLNSESTAAAPESAVASAPATSTASEPPTPATKGVYAVDPRSYTAKTVGQRMMIISAGVVMNLIFAVIFAAFAFQSGVPYVPCEIGNLIPGGPAWSSGLQPNTRIIQIGEDGKKREQLRFDFDLRQSVQTNADHSDLAFLCRDPKGAEAWVKVRPFTIHEGWESYSTIGVMPTATTTLNEAKAVFDNTAAAAASPALQGNDKIVSVDGKPIANEFELREYLIRNADKNVTLGVERSDPEPAKTTQKLDVSVPPQRLRDLGLVMEYGPITSIRPDSAAAKAGLRAGDLIVGIDGQPVVDAMLLPELLRKYYGQEVELSVQRNGEKSPVSVRVAPEIPLSYDWASVFVCPMASDSLGVAFHVTRNVKEVRSDSPAAKAGLRPGDVITGIEFAWDAAHAKQEKLPRHGKLLTLDDQQYRWPAVFKYLQDTAPGEMVRLTYVRNGNTSVAEMVPVEIDAFSPDRGFVLPSRNEKHKADSVKEAVALGARQTWEDAFRVVGILKKLVTGQLSLANFGGIPSIAYVAGKEAEQGTTRLLIFLTMLSANLAVLNFLPIPALDGGHMMFLLYEAIFRKPVNERLQVALTIAGVVCLLGLMIFVNAMDVQRFFFR